MFYLPLLSALVHAGQPGVATTHSSAWCFGSGLKLMYSQDTSRPELQFYMLIDGGSRTDGDHPGIAHLVEHLWFRSHVEDNNVDGVLSTMGARYNAYTSPDRTVYDTRAPERSIRALLSLSSARLLDPLSGITEQEFETEKNVVLSELSQRYSGTGAALEPLMSALFPPSHPYSRMTGGTHESVQQITLADTKAYVKEHYRPEQVTIHISGPFSSDKFADYVTQTFPTELLADASGQVNGRCVPRPESVPFQQREPTEPLQLRSAVSEPTAYVAWAVPPEKEVLTRFDRGFVEYAFEEALKRPVDCSVDSRDFATLLYCTFEIGSGEDIQKLSKKAIIASTTYWDPSRRQTLGTRHELWQFRARGRLMRSTGNGGGEIAATHFHRTGSQDWLDAEIKKYVVKDYSLAAEFGRKWLSRKRAQLAVVSPEGSDPERKIPPHAGRGIDGVTVSADAVNTAYLERIVAEPTWTKVQTLPNGLRVAVVTDPSSPMLRAELLFAGSGSNTLNLLTWSSLPEYTWEQKKSAIYGLGGVHEQRTGNGWMFGGSGVDASRVLQIIRDHLVTQVPGALPKPPKHWKRKSSYAAAREQQINHISPGSYLSKETWELALEHISRKETKALAKQTIQPTNALLVLHGPQSAQELIDLAHQVFQDWKGKPVDPPKRSRSTNSHVRPAVFAIDSTVKVDQSSISAMCRVDAPTSSTAKVAAAAIRREAERVLRSTEGVTYGVHSELRYDTGGWRMEIYTDVDASAVDLGVNTIRSVIAGFAKEPISPAHLALAKRDVAVEVADLYQGPWDRMRTLGWKTLYGQSNTSVAAEIAAVSPKDISTALSTCAGHEVFAIVGEQVARYHSP